ncbi:MULTISPECIES: AbgT family transporter [unclassified Spiroplasma]|uniref:AbgT family transporter n=1 Tax=unclassified Spiroplasma TaxID=2637901 RepID=UPI00313CEB35
MEENINRRQRTWKKVSSGVNKGINKSLNGIEWLGNKLPKPFYLFIYLIIILMLVSLILSYALPDGVVLEKFYDRNTNKVVDEYQLKFFNLIGRDGIVWWLKNFIKNFMGLATTGIVLLTTVFVGVADKSGFIDVSLRKVGSSLPKVILTPACIFLGCISSLAADAGYLILIPLAGTLYYRVGRHPLTGMAAVFAGVAGGFATSLIPGSVEFIMASLTNDFLGKGSAYQVNPLSTYYFTLLLLFVFTLIGWFITEKVVDKRIIAHYPIAKRDDLQVNKNFHLDDQQRKAMWFVLGFVIIYIIGILLMTFIPQAPFNGFINNITNITPNKNLKSEDYQLTTHLVLIIGFLFLGIGITYGFAAKTFKTKDDIVNALVIGFKKTAPSLILFLVMTQFIAGFAQSGIDIALGYYIGSAINFNNTTLTLFVFIVIVTIINLFIGSMSVKWGILGPIFVMALLKSQIHPAAAIAAYRVGDASTNMISPLMPYFPLIIIWAKEWIQPKQKEKFEIGSMMSIMFPYSLSFLLMGTIIFLLWSVTGLPVGVDGPIYIDVVSSGNIVKSIMLPRNLIYTVQSSL